MTMFSHCPYCGNLLKNKFEKAKKRLVCNQGHTVYLNSKPAVGALIVDDNQNVLLTQRAKEPYKGHWDIPGGFLELGEHPIEGIIREIQEELGIQINIERFLGHFIGEYSEKDEFVLSIFYLVTADVTKAKPQDDISAYKWFSIDKLPNNLSFTVNYSALQVLRDSFVMNSKLHNTKLNDKNLEAK